MTMMNPQTGVSTMTTETLISRTLVRDLPDRTRVVAVLEIVHYAGNSHPHFSVTGEVYEPHGTWTGAARHRNGRDCDACGQVHNEILRAFPRLGDIVAMHLSTWPSGEPMHAEANATYYYFDRHLEHELSTYGQAYVEQRGTGRERAARILRCTPHELPVDASPEQFTAFVDAQRERWAREAKHARALLDALPPAASV